MSLLTTTIAVIAAQTALGLCCVAAVAAAFGATHCSGTRVRLRDLARWKRAARGARWALPLLLLTLAGLAGLTGRSGTARGFAAPGLVTLILTGAPLAVGLWLLIAAGRLERRGLRLRARRQARLGGTWAIRGGAVLVATLGVASVAALQRPEAGPGLILGAIAIGGAGFAGLLGGLSRKPRPAGWLAALLYAVGLAPWIAAAV